MVRRKLGPGNFSSCPNGSSQWIWDVFGECAQDAWDEASVGLGLISIFCFAASTFPRCAALGLSGQKRVPRRNPLKGRERKEGWAPGRPPGRPPGPCCPCLPVPRQYIKACKTGNMDQALSLWFLLGWIGGDSCNLIGSFLADQLPLQTYTAIYYVLADLTMLTLYFHYKFKKRPSLLSAPINSVLLFILGTVCTMPLLRGTSPVAAQREVFRGRTLLSVEPGNKPFTKQEIIGFVIGSISSVLYLLSRLPQIRTNPSWPPVPAEVNPGHLLLAVRAGDAGEHAVWTECAAQKPRGRPERGQLPAAPPALAHGQPGRAAA
ncbi:lysosomal amino acid transporter 1 homolog isoform X2 [Marmota marmota marmota]|uniref:lysosomal amino acid transporter 1 homolog isoform X2 n=1 Tax=Marmota marmota marmota TaxID=9994 RepID=UPI002092B662|nr:lysosomal amino acid transporter 1 homolog isoform X2 [Marmota marmota marmota]